MAHSLIMIPSETHLKKIFTFSIEKRLQSETEVDAER